MYILTKKVREDVLTKKVQEDVGREERGKLRSVSSVFTPPIGDRDRRAKTVRCEKSQ